MRNHPKQFKPFPLESFPREVADVIDFGAEDFIDDDSNDLDAFLLKQGLVQRDFVDRSPDSSLCDDNNLGPENSGHLCVRQIKYGPYTGVPGPFTQNEVLLPRDAVEC